MKHIQILDCTLRDGGYVNNWEFGKETIAAVCQASKKTGVDIIELGFFRDEPYFEDRAIFSSTEQISQIVGRGTSDVQFAGMIEMSNYYPPEYFPPYEGTGPGIIRCVMWKRALDEAYAYAETLVKKGYRFCCQPTRVDQYTDAQFAELCQKFSALSPYAVYIVDTFGLLQKEDLLRYARIGHENLGSDIILGYHAHNNMDQAFGNACAFLEQDYGDRVLQVDASIGGIGRGAGNLKLEAILHYLNTYHRTNYDLTPIYEVWDKHLSRVKKEHPWGPELPYFITAAHGCNPNYALAFMEMGLSTSEIYQAIQRIQGDDIFLYSKEKAIYYSKK